MEFFMKKIVLVVVLLMTAIFCSACVGPPQVLRQDIPVSTNPMGADIYVDGSRQGVTPSTVSLERNKDHIVTLAKDNYGQADVTVKRKYKETSLVDAINSGVSAGLFHNDVNMGVSSGLNSMSYKESTGEMFVLTPSVINVVLAPLSGAASGVAPSTVGTRVGQPGLQSRDTGSPELDKKALAKDLLKVGGTAATSQMKPIKKTKTLSSSSSTYTRSDGTIVTKKKSTSASVSFNPSGVVDLLDKLFN
jgi:hypothetical protein